MLQPSDRDTYQPFSWTLSDSELRPLARFLGVEGLWDDAIGVLLEERDKRSLRIRTRGEERLTREVVTAPDALHALTQEAALRGMKPGAAASLEDRHQTPGPEYVMETNYFLDERDLLAFFLLSYCDIAVASVVAGNFEVGIDFLIYAGEMRGLLGLSRNRETIARLLSKSGAATVSARRTANDDEAVKRLIKAMDEIRKVKPGKRITRDKAIEKAREMEDNEKLPARAYFRAYTSLNKKTAS